jgi:hypothetical protein
MMAFVLLLIFLLILLMEKPVYDLKSSADKLRFFFESKGKKNIPKAIIYTPIEGYDDAFELSFGDITDDGYIDFMSESHNQDLEMVLATVISTIDVFFEKYPYALVYFRGSTPARTRLYRAIIAKQMQKLKLSHHVFGLKNDGLTEDFDKNNVYIGYLIQMKYEKEN